MLVRENDPHVADTQRSHPSNGSRCKLRGRFRPPKPERRGGCRRGVASNDCRTATAVTPAPAGDEVGSSAAGPRPGRDSFTPKLASRPIIHNFPATNMSLWRLQSDSSFSMKDGASGGQFQNVTTAQPRAKAGSPLQPGTSLSVPHVLQARVAEPRSYHSPIAAQNSSNARHGDPQDGHKAI